MNGHGRLISLEGALALAQRCTHTLTELGVDSRASVRLGQFAETIAGALGHPAPVRWAFIDGHHGVGDLTSL